MSRRVHATSTGRGSHRSGTRVARTPGEKRRGRRGKSGGTPRAIGRGGDEGHAADVHDGGHLASTHARRSDALGRVARGAGRDSRAKPRRRFFTGVAPRPPRETTRRGSAPAQARRHVRHPGRAIILGVPRRLRGGVRSGTNAPGDDGVPGRRARGARVRARRGQPVLSPTDGGIARRRGAGTHGPSRSRGGGGRVGGGRRMARG